MAESGRDEPGSGTDLYSSSSLFDNARHYCQDPEHLSGQNKPPNRAEENEDGCVVNTLPISGCDVSNSDRNTAKSDDVISKSDVGAPDDSEGVLIHPHNKAGTPDSAIICPKLTSHNEAQPGVDSSGQESDMSASPVSSSCCCQKKNKGLPPGPRGLPLLGAALTWHGPETNWEWSQQYGPLYSVRMGPSQLVYLNTVELVERYMESDTATGAALLGRPEGPAAIANGLLFGQGERWEENRQAFVRAMRQTSFTQRYDDVIHQEVSHVVQQLSLMSGQPLQLRHVLLPAVTHGLATLLLGESLARDGEDMVTLTQQMTLLADEVDLTSLALRLFLKLKRFRRVLQWLSGHTIPDMFSMSQKEQSVIRGWITRRREALTLAGGQADPHALLDQLLTSPEYVSRGEEFDAELIQSSMDLFNGGVATVLSLVDFAILFLLHNPHVQDRMRAEVTQALTSGHRICWAERSHFPFTQAVLVETLRLASVTPSSLPHTATQHVHIENYGVPKGTIVLAGIFSLHRDPRHYSDAHTFFPDRYLSHDGRRLMEPRSFRPFGVGARQCLGHHMAQVELFVMLATLVSTFRLQAHHPSTLPPFRTKMRVVRRLEPFTCVLKLLDNDAV